MTNADISDVYRGYIACLNRQDWPRLDRFVHDEVRRNGKPLEHGAIGREPERDFDEIPDLRFDIRLLVAEPPYVASRLVFECAPKGTFLGLPVNGKRVSFAENVFYEFLDGRIVEVWSVIDKAAIEAQLENGASSGAASVP